MTNVTRCTLLASLVAVALCLTPVFAAVYTATDVPLSFEDRTPLFVTSTIEIEDAGTVADVNVTLNISHTSVGDLNVVLISPDGTPVLLAASDWESIGANYTGTTFDDEAAGWIGYSTPPPSRAATGPTARSGQ